MMKLRKKVILKKFQSEKNRNKKKGNQTWNIKKSKGDKIEKLFQIYKLFHIKKIKK